MRNARPRRSDPEVFPQLTASMRVIGMTGEGADVGASPSNRSCRPCKMRRTRYCRSGQTSHPGSDQDRKFEQHLRLLDSKFGHTDDEVLIAHRRLATNSARGRIKNSTTAHVVCSSMQNFARPTPQRHPSRISSEVSPGR